MISLSIDRDGEALTVSFIDLAVNQACKPHQFTDASKVKALLDYMKHELACPNIVLYNEAQRVTEDDNIASYRRFSHLLDYTSNLQRTARFKLLFVAVICKV